MRDQNLDAGIKDENDSEKQGSEVPKIATEDLGRVSTMFQEITEIHDVVVVQAITSFPPKQVTIF